MSGNITTNSRSMNGIISLYSEDINVNNLDANNIDVENLQIENALIVDNTTITPVEVSTLQNINTQLTIQQQFNNINTELGNVVHKTGNETVAGIKNFVNTLQLTTGSLLTNNPNFTPSNTTISSAVLSTLKNIDTTRTIQEQINSVSIDGFMDLPSTQTATGFKIFSNGIQVPNITNQETSGTVSAFFISNNQLLYTSYTGNYTVNVSKLTGIDCNGKIINVFDTVNNLITITGTTTPKTSIYTLESYKANDATTEIFVYGGTLNLQQNQGFIFNSISDFIDVINTNSFFPLYTTSIPSSYIQTFQGYIKNQKLITPTSITYDNFIEGTGTNRPCIIREDNPQLTNIYLIVSPNTITDEPIKSTPSGFIKNGNFWLRSSYSLSDNNFVEGSTTTIQEGTQIINSNVNSYQYTTSVNDSPSYLTKTGFVASNVLRIYDTNGIILLTGVYNTTDNNGEYGFINAINPNNTIGFIKGVIYPQPFQTLNAYIDSNLNLICLTNNVGKFSSLDTITKINNVIETNIYSISSPNTISADIPSKLTKAYKYNATTLILESTVNNQFFFELPNVLNQRGSFSTDFNTHYCTVINSDYITPQKSGNFKCVIRPVSGGFHIFFGGYSAIGTNDFVVNETLAPVSSCCRIENPIYIPNFTYNSTEIEALENSLSTSTALISQTSYAIMLNLYYVFENNSGVSINDILIKNTSNLAINGRNIISQPGVGNCVNVLAQNYIEQTNIFPRASNKSWSKYKNSPILTATSQYSASQIPAVGNFVICNNPDFIAGRITSIQTVGTNYELTISPNPSTGAQETGSDLFIYNAYGTMDVYRPVDFEVYESTDIRAFTQTQDFYESKSYKFYQQETNDIYENRDYDEFQNNNTDVYSNNTYNIDTTVLLDLPNTGVNDTFVLQNFQQNLSQKVFLDDTSFLQDITVNNTITGQYLVLSRDLSCRDIDGIGTLTMSSQTKEHPISNVYIGRLFSSSSNNYGIAINGTSWTDPFDNNTFVLTKNVSNNITVLNSPAEVWTTINNSLRLKVADEVVEFYFAGNSRFSSNNASTRLYRTNNNSGADVFANDNNVFMDFFTLNKDYDVRLQFQRRDSADGTGWFDCFAYRGRFWTGTQKMLEWGYINSANSFLMGAYGGTWIQFNTNSEIYYQVNNATRFVMASNGVMYATGGFVQGSDRRLKKNIQEVSNALEIINTLKVKEFDKKCSMDCEDCTEETIHQIGFIAQEVQETDLSFCVSHSLLNDTLGIENETIFSLNVKATQELHEIVKTQEEQINLLKEEINLLKNKLSYLNI